MGNALSFDGMDDKVTIGDPTSGVLDFGTGSFSYGMWIYPTRYADWEAPFSKGGSSVAIVGYSIFQNSSGSLYTALSDGSTSKVTYFYTSSTPLNQWTHIFAVIDRSAQKMKVYANGAFPDTTPPTTPGTPTASNVTANSLTLNWTASNQAL